MAGFMLAGPGVGVAAGALVAVAILVVAARQRPLGPIDSAPADEAAATCSGHYLPARTDAAERSSASGGRRRHRGEADVLVLAPTPIRFLDRWASDVEPARQAAQKKLVATVAALAKAGIEAEARVGDEDVVQAVEDQLQTFPATEVVLVSDAGERTSRTAATELEPGWSPTSGTSSPRKRPRRSECAVAQQM